MGTGRFERQDRRDGQELALILISRILCDLYIIVRVNDIPRFEPIYQPLALCDNAISRVSQYPHTRWVNANPLVTSDRVKSEVGLGPTTRRVHIKPNEYGGHDTAVATG